MAGAAGWYAVAVAPRREVSVSRRSSDIGVTAFHPTGRRERIHRGRVTHMQAAVMPGYVFVHVDEPKQFSQFRRHLDADDVVPDCQGFVGADGPQRVPNEQVGDLMSRAASGDFDDVEREGRYWAPRWLRQGRSVRVTAGPFEGSVGKVWRLTAARRVSMFLTMLGGLRLVELDIDQLARAR